MKTIVSFFLSIAMFAAVPVANAQFNKAQMKEQQEKTKMSRDQLNKKASKDARNEAKRLAKEGWKPAPGGLPLEKQLDRSYIMMYEQDDNYQNKFLTAEAMSIGNSFDAAKMQALELAKQSLAGQIQTEATAIVENTLSNQQLDPGQAVSVTESMSKGKTFTSQTLGRTIPVVEVYRDLPNGNKEVLVRIFYEASNVRRMANQVIRDQMKQDATRLAE